MEHLAKLRNTEKNKDSFNADFMKKAQGAFFTGPKLAKFLAKEVCQEYLKGKNTKTETISIIDPFCGDGRLITNLLEEAFSQGICPSKWQIHIWDLDEDHLKKAKGDISQTCKKLGLDFSINLKVGDAFHFSEDKYKGFDVVLTNPPWENIKPDRRELKNFDPDTVKIYTQALREYDAFIGKKFPRSRPKKKFAGWGTNLSRVGLELALKLMSQDGLLGIIFPATFFADSNSVGLRHWLFSEFDLCQVCYFPAEAKLFGKADTQSCSLIIRNSKPHIPRFELSIFDKDFSKVESEECWTHLEHLERNDFILPISMGTKALKLMENFLKFPTFGKIEKDVPNNLWAGRELDETGLQSKLDENGNYKVLRGRQIERFRIRKNPDCFSLNGFSPPISSEYERIVWRDISRPNQERRVWATIIPKGWIVGNSLGVAYFKDGDQKKLRLLLGLMNSIPFEFQVRAHLATGHVSLGAVRKVRLPVLEIESQLANLIIGEVGSLLREQHVDETKVEAAAALYFDLSFEALSEIVKSTPNFKAEIAEGILLEYRNLKKKLGQIPRGQIDQNFAT